MTVAPTTRRRLDRILRAALNPNHYLALARIGVYRRPIHDFIWRYVLGNGAYPHVCPVNTPSGPLDIHTMTPFDMFTISEIHGWRCYPISGAERTIVDFGANIGISMGYFLAHSPTSFVYGFEPLESNAVTAELNLTPFRSRYTLTRAAVYDRAGIIAFGSEPTGRYSGIGVSFATDEITVPCVRASEAIGAILEERGEIDVLKVDIEGGERAALGDITDAQYRAIRTILIEGEDAPFARLEALGMRHRTLPSGIHRLTWPSR